MVVTDHYTFARVFSTHDVTRNRMGDEPRVLKREVLTDHPAPAIGTEFDRGHCCEYTRSFGGAKYRIDWSKKALYKSALPFRSSSTFTIFATSWARSRGQRSNASGVSTSTRSRTPIAATNLPGLHRKLPSASRL